MGTAPPSEGVRLGDTHDRNAPAEGAAQRLMANTAPTPKAVTLVLVPALVLMLAFAFFYVGAFHDPTPHHVPVAVVGPPAVAVQLNRLPGDPLDARHGLVSLRCAVADRRSRGLRRLRDRHEPPVRRIGRQPGDRDRAGSRRSTASPAAQDRPAVHVTDVKPLPLKDPNGTAAFYAVIAWMFGGYIGATLIGLIGSPRSTSRQRAAARIAALAGFGIVAGILSVVMLRASFGVFSGHVVALCAIGALTIFASGAATAGIQAAAGPAGTGLVILVFVILGNSASGGPFARPLLPGLWRTIGGVLPPGASVDLARSALFFDGARIAGPILVLVVWAALGTSLALALGGRIMDPADTEAAAAAGAAV